MSDEHSTRHIIQSLLVNLAIAGAKGVAAVFTGSGAMLAETLHSTADCGNQLLLLLGVRHAQRPPDSTHPLGHGRSLYFWSFMVALLLFSGGGVFSIYEGIHKLMAPEPVERVGIAIAIIVFSILLEGGSTLANVREIGKRRRDKPFFRYLRDTKDSDLVVIFGENAAATLGLTFAFIALGLAYATGDGRWDAAGSVAIGAVLVGVAVFLAIEVKSLLVGESADPEIERAAREVAYGRRHIESVLNVITVQQGPGEVLVAMKLLLASEITADDVCTVINDFEVELKKRCPEIRWLFVEPDVPKTDRPLRPSNA